MPELAGVGYTLAGSGPAVVVPQLNVDWSTVDLSPLSARCTVVVVAPRGLAPSARLDHYSDVGMVADVEGVLDHLGIGDYVTFGYSMNGAMASRLGVDNPRARAVVCGGFPTTADLGAMADRTRRMNQGAWLVPADWADLLATYDPDAAVAFYEDLGRLGAGGLLDRLACPVWSWWGSDDARLEELCGLDRHQQGLEERGLPFDVLAGLDHEGALGRIDLALPGVLDWLEGLGLID